MIVNGLDILGILLFGAVGVLALGQDVEIPFLQLTLVADVRYLVPLIAGVGILFTLKTLFALSFSRHVVLYLARVESDYSTRIIERIFMGEFSLMKRYSRAETEWAVLRSSEIAFTTVLGQAITLVSETALAIGILAVLVIADVSVAMTLLSYLLVLGLVLQLWSNKLVKEAGEEYSNESVATNHALDDLVAAYREIAIAGQLPMFTRAVSIHRGAVSRAQANYSFLTSVPRYVAELGLVLGVIGLAAFFSVRDGAAESLGLLAVFAAGGLRILSAMLPLLRAFQDLRYNGPLASSAQAILAEVRDTVQDERVQEVIGPLRFEFGSSSGATKPPVDVELGDVSFSYQDRAGSDEALKHISLRIGAGEIVALAGPSGAGKSTLAELILGLHSPTTGHVRLGGVPADRFRISRPGSIGYVAQKPGLISGSIERNIVLGERGEPTNWPSLIEAVEVADLAPLIDSLPEGFQTDLGKHRDALSGGQLQKIGLARALYRKPSLVILDEATSALDAESESLVTQKILKLRGEVTVIVIAHRLSSIQEVDRIYLMDGGKIVATGTFQQLYESTALMRRYAELMKIDLPKSR
jgi:ATP-binding cassette, subfamily B, bacterial PglK